MLQNEYVLANVGFDEAENEPSKDWERRLRDLKKKQKSTAATEKGPALDKPL